MPPRRPQPDDDDLDDFPIPGATRADREARQRITRLPIDPAVFGEIEAHIVAVEHDAALVDVASFVTRDQALRVLQDRIISRIDRLIDHAAKGDRHQLRALKRHASAVRARLQQANEQLFAAVRTEIAAGMLPPRAFLQLLDGYRERHRREVWNDPPQYDRLDTFVDGLLQVAEQPREQREPDPEMVFYQATPVRIVLDLVKRLRLSADDVFYDLGSGLGRVAMVVGLASDARVKGVEYEPAYHDYAQRRVRDLKVSRVACVNADARDVDYADGTVFYLYTPFKGKILQRVFELLRFEARRRRIRVCTYGPGTLEIMEQEWLVPVDDWEPDVHRATIWQSR